MVRKRSTVEAAMRTRKLVLSALLLGGLVMIGTDGSFPGGPACAAEEDVSYSLDVAHVFQRRCAGCHTPDGDGYKASGLDLSTYQGVMKGTRFGSVIVPGEPELSNLMVLLDWRASPKLRMPHGEKQLSACDRDLIRTWIRQGAKNN
jgi:mono/diheme cytochrome c family protein